MQVKETAANYPSRRKTYTYEDYLELPDDRNRYEVINGELVMTPAPKMIHQKISGNLELNVRFFVKENKLGQVFDAPCDVLLTQKDIVQPDILFVSNENKEIVTDDNIKGAPDLVIEVLSPTTAYYDLIEKKELYERFGVKEYWIVDPKKEWIEIYALEDGKYKLHQRGEKTEKFSSRLLNGFELELKKIFGEEG